MKQIYWSLTAVVLFATGLNLNAATLALYDFTGSSLASSSTDPNTTVSDFFTPRVSPVVGNWNSSVSGVDTSSGNPAPSYAWKPPGSTTTKAAAVSNDVYWSFDVDPDSGFTMDLDSITFDLSVANNARPMSYVLRSSLDNFASDIVGTEVVDLAAQGFTLTTLNLPSLDFDDLTNSVEFRLYTWSTAGGGSSGSAWRFDNITLNGTVTVIPEPTSAALVASAFGFLLLRRRKA
ncbi:MAG: PEP-CTERM sorting domain-containing protein [Verrucomicrobiota bacterium]